MKRNITYQLILPFVILSSTIGFGQAQVIIQFTSNNDNNLNLQSIWNFQLNNLSGTTITSYVEIRITNNLTEPVITAQSPRFDLTDGMNTLSNDMVKNAKLDYGKINASLILRKEGYLPKGLYYVCITIKDAKSDAELGQNCTQSNVTFEPVTNESADQNNPKKENFFNKNVKLSGYSEITGVYSNMQAIGSLVPPSYVQWYLNPTVTLFDFPISAQLLLSSRQMNSSQNINSFNVQFDATQFANILKQRAIEFIKKKINNDKIANFNVESLTGQFNTVKSKLESPGALMELAQIKELDSLKGSLSNLQNIGSDTSGILGKLDKLKTLTGNDSIKLDTSIFGDKLDSLHTQGDSLMHSKIDSLKKKIKVLSWLEDKKPYYDKLIKQKDEFAAKLQGFNLDSLSGKFDEYSSKYDIKKLNDPNYLFSFMDQNKLFKKFEKVMTAVKSLSIGTSYPSYSDFTFKGVQVNGFNIELQKWNTSVSFTYGTAQQGITPNNPTTGNYNMFAYKRNVIGGSIGYGGKDKSHVHFTLLSFVDDPTSIYIPDSMIGISPKPQSNNIMSTDFKVQLLKKKLSFYGEIAGAQTVRNVTLIDSSFIINTPNYNNPKEWFANIVLQRNVDLNTSVDFAFKGGAEVSLFKGKTKISAQVKRVGPNFMSFGNPFMIKDMFNIEAKFSQTVWKNRITFSGFVRRNIDNLENTKLLTSQRYNFGFDFAINVPKWPSLKVSMTPYVQSNDSMHMNINVISANSNYMFKIRKMQLMTNFTFMHQDGMAGDSSMNFSSNYATLLNTLLLGKTTSISITQNYFQINNRYGDIGTYSLNLSGSVVAFKKWNSSFGGVITINSNERRYGGYYQTSIQFLKYFTFNLRMEYNRYDIIHQTIYNMAIPFDQINIRGVLITRW